ncbi:hypothetical protein BD289DRAFT_498925, partial [Coniella lustricola]
SCQVFISIYLSLYLLESNSTLLPGCLPASGTRGTRPVSLWVLNELNHLVFLVCSFTTIQVNLCQSTPFAIGSQLRLSATRGHAASRLRFSNSAASSDPTLATVSRLSPFMDTGLMHRLEYLMSSLSCKPLK